MKRYEHEALLNRIQSLAKPDPSFSVFFKNQDDITIGLNDNIQQTFNKLEYYKLTADNYLKMISLTHRLFLQEQARQNCFYPLLDAAADCSFC